MSERVTDTEQVFACEAAADSYRASGYVYDERQIRTAFSAGWEAAMEYAARKALRGLGTLTMSAATFRIK